MNRVLAVVLLVVAGFAALSWQVLWQLDLSLSLGVSAQAAALTIATVMGGMTVGALWCGRRTLRNAWSFYAWLEAGIGLSGMLPRWLLPWIEKFDAAVHQSAPEWSTVFLIGALGLSVGPASFLMGSTLPVIGQIAKRECLRLSSLYAANTSGAAVGALVLALFLLPDLGRLGSGLTVMSLDLAVAIGAWTLGRRTQNRSAPVLETSSDGDSLRQNGTFGFRSAILLALVTGFVTFVLEVSWFRLLRAAWLSTADSFAVMLACFLCALGGGAALSRKVRDATTVVPVLLCLAAVAIWFATPMLERFDVWSSAGGGYTARLIGRILLAMLVMVPPVDPN